MAVTLKIENFRKLAFLLACTTVLSSCHFFSSKEQVATGVPLVGFSFGGKMENNGLLNIRLEKDAPYSYAPGVSDSCLDLSNTATARNPVMFRFPDQYNIDDYSGFSMLVWVKKQVNDIDDYVVACHYSEDSLRHYKGWKMFANPTGSWRWEMSDGNNTWQYNPGVPRQRIDDGKWHLIGFAYNKETKEVYHYFDGSNVAVVSVEGCDSLAQQGVFSIGVDPDSFEKQRDLFNGYLDDFSYWGRPLNREEVNSLYSSQSSFFAKDRNLAGNRFSVMTWNIYHGGEYLGKTVGIERIVDIIQNSGVDVVCFQETYRAGEKIADRLGFHFYRRSDNISLISRFPITSTYNVYKKEHSGGAKIQLDGSRSVVVYPVWLSPQPDVSAYVKSGFVAVDSLLIWEQKSRGVELRFILSEVPGNKAFNKDAFIIAGNFNTGSHLDWTERNKKNNNGMAIPFSLSKTLEKDGFIDSYREVHPNEMEDPGNTWSPLFREIFSNRIDFIYYKGEKLKAVDSYVINSHRLGFPSDHALVVTEFEISE